MQVKLASTIGVECVRLATVMDGGICPSCFEGFSEAVPPVEERPSSLDYDCEICCRPMVLIIDEDGRVEARSLDDGMAP